MTVKNVEINWSDEVYSIFGIEKDDSIITFKTFLTFVHPADKTIFMKAEEDIMSGKNELDLVYRIILKDGSMKHLHQLGKIVYGPDGELLALTGTVQDITEQEQKEQEIQERNEQLRELASNLQNIREEERTYIAREIHDELGQQLTAFKIDLAWMMKRCSGEQLLLDRLSGMDTLIDHTIDTVRRISSELRPSILDDLGLAEALDWQSTEFEKRFLIPSAFRCQVPDIGIDAAIVTGLFRIYQESLTNVARHAEASSVSGSLRLVDGDLVLEVTDDGKGFDTEAVGKKGGFGLLGIKERTAMMGGQYSVSSSPGAGTTVIVCVPLKENQSKPSR